MYKGFKRAADFVISLVFSIILLPFFAIFAIWIKLDSPGPVIFKQKRLGLDGKEFDIYKFRTMCVGAEGMGTGQYSFKGDSRITRSGKILRALSIDELPQFWNILKGEMSLIGPRPVLTYHPWNLEEYTEEQLKRFNVRPGVTGLAQVNGRKELNWNERIKFDIQYVDGLSFKMDLHIFFKTIFKVVLMKDNHNKSVTVGNEKGEKVNAEADIHN